MKISDKEKKMLLYLAGLLVAIFSFQFGFSPMQDENFELESQVSTLKMEVSQLQMKVGKQQEYEEQTAQAKQDTEELLSQFPANLQAEDSILYASELEKAYKMKISNVSLGEASVAYGAETAVEGDSESTEATSAISTLGGRVLYKLPLTMDYTSTYADFKKCMEYIQQDSNRKSIDAVSISYDGETGKLIGNFVLNTYYLTNTDGMYNSPSLPGMGTGSKNIFGTIK